VLCWKPLAIICKEFEPEVPVVYDIRAVEIVSRGSVDDELSQVVPDIAAYVEEFPIVGF
jgi:hypothetical protein